MRSATTPLAKLLIGGGALLLFVVAMTQLASPSQTVSSPLLSDIRAAREADSKSVKLDVSDIVRRHLASMGELADLDARLSVEGFDVHQITDRHSISDFCSDGDRVVYAEQRLSRDLLTSDKLIVLACCQKGTVLRLTGTIFFESV